MAGDWIKMRVSLLTSPKVVRMASALKADRFRTAGGLLSVWCLFDAHSEDGQLSGYNKTTLDDLAAWPGFSDAMESVGWLKSDGENLSLPRFDVHNGASAKRRAMDSDRKRLSRKAPKIVPEMSANEPDKIVTREEKRREELKDKPSCHQQADNQAEKRDLIPYQSIVDLYNKVCGSLLPGCIKLTTERRNQIRKLWNTSIAGSKPFQSLEFWEGYFNDCLTNPHWIGQNDRGWRADLDFITKEKNAMKVLEGI